MKKKPTYSELKNREPKLILANTHYFILATKVKGGVDGVKSSYERRLFNDAEKNAARVVLLEALIAELVDAICNDDKNSLAALVENAKVEVEGK